MAKSIDEVAQGMFNMVSEAAGKKKFKPGDLVKAMIELYGDEGVDKSVCKEAIKKLVNEARLVYTYFGGSFLEVPRKEGSAN